MKINCIDCKHCTGDSFGIYCEKYRTPMAPPYQSRTDSTNVESAWKKCRGKSYVKRSFWSSLFSSPGEDL